MGDENTSSGSLATASDFTSRYRGLTEEGPAKDPASLQNYLNDATAWVEGQTTRRLCPFTSITETHPMFGLDPDDNGGVPPGTPLPWAGSLGMSFSNALGDGGGGTFVRKLWLRESAPRYQELWTYSVESINFFLGVGGQYNVNVSTLQGPYPDSGMVRFPLGDFAPEGTTAVVTYSGGYTVSIPNDLIRACCSQAAKFIILDMEPETRPGFNLDELDATIATLISTWVRP